ncbi:thioesterase II family protein [Cribrihabitans neustonicus]|uniref:thioesterase II family protein n=1 Tax=Cribrihabitans neustonicus TaxID=1429085 RepID=UPI003B596B56
MAPIMEKLTNMKPNQKSGHTERAIIVIPCAAGPARRYEPLISAFGNSIKTIVAELPGHGRRLFEPAHGNVEALCDYLETHCLPLAEQRTILLFGHSFGGLVAFELAKRLESNGLVCERLVVAGCPAPNSPVAPERSDEALGLDTLPAAISDAVRQTIEAEWQLTKRIRNTPPVAVRAPIMVLDGTDDDVPRSSLEGWADLTSASIRIEEVAGDHYFPWANPVPIARLIERWIERDRPDPPHDRTGIDTASG